MQTGSNNNTFSRLSEILICPATMTQLKADADHKTLENENGYKYEVIDSIPILIQGNKDVSGFDYQLHYEKDAELFDYFDERSGGTEQDERRVREYILSRITNSARTVLDVGCGRAWLAKELIKSKELICSLDISITNPRRALELYPSDNHLAVVADALKLPFKTGSFDCVVSSEVIEHIDSPEKFIAELFRCVKPGGSLIITTPYKEVIKQHLCIHCSRITPDNAHLHSFDEDKLRQLYTESDLDKYEWKSFGNKLLMHLRTHTILKYFPFWLWKLKDDAIGLFIKKNVHIIAIYRKKDG